MALPDATRVIQELGMEPHPEGGWFVETFRDPQPDGRGYSTAIYYLLQQTEHSRWHRVDASEVWHFYAGAPLRLEMWRDGIGIEAYILGAGLDQGERPQIVVPAGRWQSARTLGAWTLAGCTVAPGFSYEGYELAREGWLPE